MDVHRGIKKNMLNIQVGMIWLGMSMRVIPSTIGNLHSGLNQDSGLQESVRMAMLKIWSIGNVYEDYNNNVDTDDIPSLLDDWYEEVWMNAPS